MVLAEALMPAAALALTVHALWLPSAADNQPAPWKLMWQQTEEITMVQWVRWPDKFPLVCSPVSRQSLRQVIRLYY